MNRRTLALVAGGGVALTLVAGVVARRSATPFVPASSRAPYAPSVSSRASVAVFDDGEPAADRVVVFSDQAGTLLASTKTARDGTASGPMDAHGMVTVAHGTSVRHLVTITDVTPGDRLLVGEEEDEGGVAHVACRVAATLPGAHPAAHHYVVSVGVNDTEVGDVRQRVSLAALERFVVDGKVRAIARALSADGQLLAFSQAFAEGCARGDASAPTIAAYLPPWTTDLRNFTIEVKSREHGALEATVSLMPAGSDGLLLGKREAPLGPATSFAFMAPRPIGTRARSKLVVTYAGDASRASLEERRADLTEKTKVDLDERLLPRVTGAVVEGQGSARPSIHWKAAGTLAEADAIVARLAWPASREHVWTVLAPPNARSPLRVPALPDELAGWRPDAASISPVVGIIDASFWNGYADVKARGLASLEDPPDGDVVIRSSETGVIEY